MRKNYIKPIDLWDDHGDRYLELRVGTGGACVVKETPSGLRYVLECEDGNNIYSYVGGADYPLRKLTDEEVAKVMEIADNEFNKVN